LRSRRASVVTREAYGVSGVNDLRRDLEGMPPDVDAVLTRIRKLLAGPRSAA